MSRRFTVSRPYPELPSLQPMMQDQGVQASHCSHSPIANTCLITRLLLSPVGRAVNHSLRQQARCKHRINISNLRKGREHSIFTSCNRSMEEPQAHAKGSAGIHG